MVTNPLDLPGWIFIEGARIFLDTYGFGTITRVDDPRSKVVHVRFDGGEDAEFSDWTGMKLDTEDDATGEWTLLLLGSDADGALLRSGEDWISVVDRAPQLHSDLAAACIRIAIHRQRWGLLTVPPLRWARRNNRGAGSPCPGADDDARS